MRLKILIAGLAIGLFATLLTACAIGKPAQTDNTQTYVPADQPLYDTIARQDSLLFAAFNSRNLSSFKTFFSKDLEVYQDNVGVRNYEQAIEAFEGLFEQEYILTRQLMNGSLEVYPVKDYGAIETGRHTFCHVENGKNDCGTFMFMHIWKRESGQWKITRIITYGH